jgi:hypothetical protein
VAKPALCQALGVAGGIYEWMSRPETPRRQASGLGWIPWAWDDIDKSNCTADNNWFSMTYTCGVYTTPSTLTFGLDVALNPVYGWDALAIPSEYFLTN